MVHDRFFEPLFRLRSVTARTEEAAHTQTSLLARFMDSKRVNERDDDDKTLHHYLAVRIDPDASPLVCRASCVTSQVTLSFSPRDQTLRYRR